MLSARRLWTALCCPVLVLGLAACGVKEAHPHVADTEGFYVDAGPMTYQVQLSRELNQYNVEDMQYLRGVAPRQRVLTPAQMWFGVFMWAKNQTSHNAPTTDSFDIVDTQGTRYFPLHINPLLNPFAWTATLISPGATQPGPGSVASNGPTQGGELLFKLNTQAVYADRPLTLEIRSPAGQLWGTVSLDL